MSYVVEYAKSDRSTCSGPKNICPSETKDINEGELRLGVQPKQLHGVSWRHWTCTTPQVFKNMKTALGKPEKLGKFDELREEDKERIVRAWENGRIPLNEKPEPYAHKIDKEEEGTSNNKKEDEDDTKGASKSTGEKKHDEKEVSKDDDEKKDAAKDTDKKKGASKGAKEKKETGKDADDKEEDDKPAKKARTSREKQAPAPTTEKRVTRSSSAGNNAPKTTKKPAAKKRQSDTSDSVAKRVKKRD